MGDGGSGDLEKVKANRPSDSGEFCGTRTVESKGKYTTKQRKSHNKPKPMAGITMTLRVMRVEVRMDRIDQNGRG